VRHVQWEECIVDNICDVGKFAEISQKECKRAQCEGKVANGGRNIKEDRFG